MYEMLLTVVALISGIIVCRNVIKEMTWAWINPTFFDFCFGIFIGFIIFAFVIGGGMLIGAGIQYKFFGTHESTEYTKIVSLNQNHATEGQFFLGSGSVKGEEYYLYFENLGDNKYIRRKIETHTTIIQEGENENPRLEWIRVKGNTNKFMRASYIDVKKDYILYVPDNTIIKQFRLE
jgi:hypothetical protein